MVYSGVRVLDNYHRGGNMKRLVIVVLMAVALVAAPFAGAADCSNKCCYCNSGECLEAGGPQPNSYSTCQEGEACRVLQDGSEFCVPACYLENICYWA